jgi:hypothetical protein
MSRVCKSIIEVFLALVEVVILNGLYICKGSRCLSCFIKFSTNFVSRYKDSKKCAYIS